MSGGRKGVQTGVRVKLQSGATWDQLAQLAPGDVRNRKLLPQGFMPLPHVKHLTGGQVFPQEQIDAIGRAEDRNLKRFDVDYLKIDGSFVRDLARDQGSRLFVRALNDVARGLSKQVIAEWVETPEVLRILTDMGTQYGQGYLFQQPEPLERAVEPLRARA